MGLPANLQLDSGGSSRETPLDYQCWTKICCFRLGFQSPCQGAQGPGLLRLRLPREYRRLPMGMLFCRDFFSFSGASSYRRSIWVPVQTFIFGTTSCVENTWYLLPLVAQDPTPRAHRLFVWPTATLAVPGRVLTLVSHIMAPAFSFNRLSASRPPRHAGGPRKGFDGGLPYHSACAFLHYFFFAFFLA